MKTSELTGLALRYAVILSQFPNAFDGKPSIRDICEFYPYDEDWHLAGPIIEGEKIGVWWATHVIDDEGTEYGNHWYAEPGMTDENADKSYTCMTGPTPLIAAMRCYVASKLGDEVDVPKELCK